VKSDSGDAYEICDVVEVSLILTLEALVTKPLAYPRLSLIRAFSLLVVNDISENGVEYDITVDDDANDVDNDDDNVDDNDDKDVNDLFNTFDNPLVTLIF
jgi:hypothetical protein